MRIGVVSDIHCNEAGLRAGLDLMGSVDALLCLGDAIYEFRFSNEVVALLRDSGATTIQGNHETSFFGPQGERARARPGIDPDLSQWLRSRPERAELDLAGKRLLLVHSTPWAPGEYVFPGDPRLRHFADVDADYVLYGHTHAQLVERVGAVTIVNPGSAGEARNHRNGSLLSCAVIDLAADEVRVIEYPDPTAP